MFESLTSALEGVFKKLSGNAIITESNIREGLKAVRLALLEADVSLPVVKDFVQKVQERALGAEVLKGVRPSEQFIKIVHDELTALLGGEMAPIPWQASGPTVLLLAGLQGSGKTTTAGKLANLLRTKHKKSPLLVAADIQRPAAIEQLKVLGQQLNIPVFHEPGLQAPEVAARAMEFARKNLHDLVIIDSAGRLHVDDDLMNELLEVCGKTKPHQIYLVLDSMTGQDAVRSAEAFNARLAIDGVILTKLDGDSRGGAALSVRSATNKPIRFVGVGEKMDAIEEFFPDRMAGRILGMGDVISLVERAQERLDEDKAKKLEKEMMAGQFTFEMFLEQLEEVKKLGSMKDILGFLPGIGSKLKDIDIPEGEINKIRGIIHSMTPHERRQPDLIDGQRRARIARGAGVQVSQINDLLVRFAQMKKMMRGLTGRMKHMMGADGNPNQEITQAQLQGLATGRVDRRDEKRREAERKKQERRRQRRR